MRAVALVAGAVFSLGTAQAESGLVGAYYQLSAAPGNNANAESAIVGSTPTATFVATTICYPSCDNTASDSTSLSSFLGTNATGLSPNTVNNLDNHVLTLTGYLNIAAAGTYTFSLGSDDGSKLVIDGVTLSNDGDHAFNTVSLDYTLSAGQHTISILQFEDVGATGLTVKINGAALDSSILQTTPVPEPETWALFSAAIGVMGVAVRRRRAMG